MAPSQENGKESEWKDVVRYYGADIEGGDLQVHHPRLVLRGPIKSIEYDEATESVTIALEWTASREVKEGQTGFWRAAPIVAYSFDAKSSPPTLMGDKMIQFNFNDSKDCDAIIYFKGGQKLHPEAVHETTE